MEERQERRGSPILYALVIVLGLMLLYVGGYFWLSNAGTITRAYGTVRVVQQARFFPNKTWAAIYRPAAAIESLARDEEVLSSYQNDL